MRLRDRIGSWRQRRDGADGGPLLRLPPPAVPPRRRLFISVRATRGPPTLDPLHRGAGAEAIWGGVLLCGREGRRVIEGRGRAGHRARGRRFRGRTIQARARGD